MIMEEEWKFIKGYKNHYQVSNLGRVKSCSRIVKTKLFGGTTLTVKEKLMKLELLKGYKRVTLSKKGLTKRFFVHRLVAIHFGTKVNSKRFINHIDGDKTNNNISNLEWCTSSENEKHAYRFLGKTPPMAKTVLDLEMGIYYDSISKAAIAKNIHPGALLSSIQRKRNYTSIVVV